jgi:hypothetical protein
MNAPASDQKNEEGGMLVAALAGGAILLAVALVVFSGGDDEDASESGDKIAASAAGNSSKSKGSSASAIGARKVDDANAGEGGRDNDPNAGSASATPRKAHRTTRAAGEGMSAAPVDKQPPTFETKEDELKWWNRQLDGAKQLQTRRERQMSKLPEMEAKISEAANPEAARESFEKKRERLELALQRSHEQVADLEAKVAGLQ